MHLTTLWVTIKSFAGYLYSFYWITMLNIHEEITYSKL